MGRSLCGKMVRIPLSDYKEIEGIRKSMEAGLRTHISFRIAYIEWRRRALHL